MNAEHTPVVWLRSSETLPMSVNAVHVKRSENLYQAQVVQLAHSRLCVLQIGKPASLKPVALKRAIQWAARRRGAIVYVSEG